MTHSTGLLDSAWDGAEGHPLLYVVYLYTMVSWW